MEKSFTVKFPTGATARAVQVSQGDNLSKLLGSLGLELNHPVLVIVGGASKLAEKEFDRVRQLFGHVLAPLAQKWGATVVDGGTDVGVMRLMGQARLQVGGTFPLVGVIPVELAILPDQANSFPDAAPLEPNHTHFVLIPGSNWGDESAWIADVASALTDVSDSLTVLINGGEIAWQDASESVQADRSLVVVAGSGRTADILAAALNGRLTDDRAKPIVSSGLVQAIDLEAEAAQLARIIEEIFASG